MTNQSAIPSTAANHHELGVGTIIRIPSPLAHMNISAPSISVQHLLESHIPIGHVICHLAEQNT